MRDKELNSYSKQKKIAMATDITSEIAEAAMELFRESYQWKKPIRSIGVRGCDLVDACCPVQLDLFISQEKRERLHKMDMAVDTIRKRFGFESIQRGLMYQDRFLSKVNAKDDHTVHPHGYFEGGNRTGVELLKVN